MSYTILNEYKTTWALMSKFVIILQINRVKISLTEWHRNFYDKLISSDLPRDKLNPY